MKGPKHMRYGGFFELKNNNKKEEKDKLGT